VPSFDRDQHHIRGRELRRVVADFDRIHAERAARATLATGHRDEHDSRVALRQETTYTTYSNDDDTHDQPPQREGLKRSLRVAAPEVDDA
jgi:hypothetical protein